MRPDHAEFGITIDFDRGTSNPVKIFSAMTEMLRAVREMDTILLGAVDPELIPEMVLEDVETESITSWVRNKIAAIDDQALKEFDPKQQIGKYAVKAKYRIIEYLDEREVANEYQRLENLRADLEKLAHKQKLRALPIPGPVNMKRLAKPMDQLQDAKKLLGPNHRATFRSDGKEHELDKHNTKQVSSVAIEEEEQATSGHLDMVLLVRKPDMIADAQWEFRHGKTSIHAHVLDERWLQRFRRGEEILVPGSFMSCKVEYKHRYSSTGALLSSSYDVVSVYGVLPPDGSLQLDMLED